MGAFLAAATLVLACGKEAPARDLTVALGEWEVAPAVQETPPGKIAFVVSNEGGAPHELVVVKTDLPPGDLTVTGGKVDESRLNGVGRLAALQPGAAGRLEVELTGGKYVLLCNLSTNGESHYAAGMFAGLFVTP